MNSNRPLTYLGCPYNSPSPEVRHERFEKVSKVAAILFRHGCVVYSPISHSHSIAEAGGLHLSWDFWEAIDRIYIGLSHQMYVLVIPGWRESVGVQAEIKIAKEQGIPVRYLNENGDVVNVDDEQIKTVWGTIV